MTITADTTINAAIQQYPSVIRVFTAAGLDTCCGGALPIAEAAKKHGIDVNKLLDDVNSATNEDYESCCKLCGV
jgi:iron-sulfur cluster repair protein YtfE (RIC family)